LGIKSQDEEENERNYCEAFPDAIPDEVAYGENLHSYTLPEQENNLIYVKK
jgi:hypothetical protein